MLAHRLRHRVEFQRQEQTQNPISGAIGVVWVPAVVGGVVLESVPAEVLTGPGRELQASDSKQAQTTARVNLRWFPVDRLELYTWRILWDGRVFNIVSAETDLTARQEWRLRCEDGLTDGR